MKTRTKHLLSWADTDPARTLAPIQRLVVIALVCAVLATALLAMSVLHVMSTTTEMSMAGERIRASRIADLLQRPLLAETRPDLDHLGHVAGLEGLILTAQPATDTRYQSIPLLGGPSGGQYLTWKAATPGAALAGRYAPVRVPLILAMIAGVLLCLFGMLRHVGKIEQQRALAQRQALRDHLTGLPNRLALDHELVRLAAGGEHFSVLAFDLDRFKPINDLFGHHAGDLALIEISHRLAAQLQPGELLARIGGDEFVAVVHRGERRSVLAQLARDCVTAVSRPLHVVGQNVSVGISIGVVDTARRHAPGTLLKHADRTLYEAKRRNAGTFVFAPAGAAFRESPEPAPGTELARPFALAAGF